MINKVTGAFDIRILRPQDEWFADFLSAQPEGGPRDVLALWNPEDHGCLLKIMDTLLTLQYDFHLREFPRTYPDKA